MFTIFSKYRILLEIYKRVLCFREDEEFERTEHSVLSECSSNTNSSSLTELVATNSRMIHDTKIGKFLEGIMLWEHLPRKFLDHNSLIRKTIYFLK